MKIQGRAAMEGNTAKMMHYVNYEGGRLDFSLPQSWHIISRHDENIKPDIPEANAEIDRALNNPIGAPLIEEIARPGMDVVLLFDDHHRPTPAFLALPKILNRLNKAGIPDHHVRAVCAGATHPAPSNEQLRVKVGDEVMARLKDRITIHDAKSPENIMIGKTHKGNIVEINKFVALADLIIGVGECMPHPGAGYGGGFKIIMPGVSSYRAIADHHFTNLRHKNSHVNLLDGNPFWEEIVDAGRLARLAFKLDFVMNERGQVIKAFAGDPEAQQRKAASFAESLYVVSLPKLADITITSAAPLEIGVQATKALTMATRCTRSGGTIVWVASQKQAGPILPLIEEIGNPYSANEMHHRLSEGDIPNHLSHLGISYITQIVSFKEMTENFSIVHVTEGLTKEQVAKMGMTYSPEIQTAIDGLAGEYPYADVAVFPSGGNVIPEVK
jgi:lactate racemase